MACPVQLPLPDRRAARERVQDAAQGSGSEPRSADASGWGFRGGLRRAAWVAVLAGIGLVWPPAFVPVALLLSVAATVALMSALGRLVPTP